MLRFHDRLAKIANEEWDYFGNQTIDTLGRTIKRGKVETDPGYWQRVGHYWDEIGGWTKDKTGKDTDWPWSAVFISYCIKLAGMTEREFEFAIGHSQYILAAAQKKIPWLYMDILDTSPKVGDILCYHREQRGTLTYNSILQNPPNHFRSHGDIVVEKKDDRVSVIGGNVSNGVTKRNIKLENGCIVPDKKQWFCILRYQNMFL